MFFEKNTFSQSHADKIAVTYFVNHTFLCNLVNETYIGENNRPRKVDETNN